MALLYDQPADAQALQSATQRTCGYTFAYQATNQNGGGVNGPGNSTTIARWQHDTPPVTTVFCFFCSDRGFQQDATAAAYFPEWLFVGPQDDDNFQARQEHPDQFKNAVGITWKWRQPAMAQTWWWRAYQETDPQGAPDTSFGLTIYQELMQLFGAIQLAGPVLNPKSVAAGMPGWQPRAASDGSSPGGGYAPHLYELLGDYMLEKWDPTGSPPGGSQGNDEPGVLAQGGCFRLVDGGARHDGPGDSGWPSSDEGAASAASEPCQADIYDYSDSPIDEEKQP